MLQGGQNPSLARNHQVYRLPACAGNAKLPGPALFGKVLGYFRVVPRYAAAAQISAVGCALGWELGRAVEWCCQRLLPAFLAPIGVPRAGANAGGMPARHRGGRWTYLGQLDWVRCGWPQGRVMQVGLRQVSWASALCVSTIPAMKLMHEAGWGASQPSEQAAGDPRSVTSSRVLGAVVRGLRPYA